MRKLFAPLVLLILAACGGGGTEPKPARVALVTLSQNSATLVVGSTLTLTATAQDGSGNALTGRAVTWSTSSAATATVSGGIVTAMAPGLAAITATVEGKSAEAAITVQLVPVATVTVAPATSSLDLGATQQLTATLRDATGNVLAGRAVAWSSDDETRASVSATGLVTTHAPGRVVITATSEGQHGSATLTISGPDAPAIEAITPDTLVAGATATITGTRFASSTDGNTVTIAGQPVVITAATATRLDVMLPRTLPCEPTGSVAIVVTTSQGEGRAQHTLRVARERSFAVGDAMLITDAGEVGCNELAATGGRYFVSVYSASTIPSSLASFELRGARGPASSNGPFAAASEPPRVSPSLSAAGAGLGEVLDAARRAEAARQHSALLEETRRVGREILARPSRAHARAAATPLPAVGSIVPMKVRELADCNSFTQVGARVVYVGAKAIVLEDTLAPFARQNDADYEFFGRAFDDVMYPMLTENFGDPLAYDAKLDANGRIFMLFTPKVNQFGGLAGFISPCDFTNTFPASNDAEVFYATVQDVAGWDHAVWRAFMPGTIIHEAKHLASFAERLASPTATTFETGWLEEATAQVASELYARRLYGTAWKGDATYQQTLFCEARYRLTTGPCAGSDYNVLDHFARLEDYFAAHETKSFYSPPQADITIYGSGWLFVRWATDQYATTESIFLRALTTDGNRAGIPNVIDKTGASLAELVGWFSLANIADDYPGLAAPGNARYAEPSWNLPDIFTSMSADLRSHPPAQPVTRHPVAFGDFAVTIPALAGGAAAYFEMSGPQTGAQLLDLHSSGGAPLGSSTQLRIGIVRVQ